MSSIVFSDAFYFELNDGDVVWPCTVNGSFRIAEGKLEKNILGKGENPVSEKVMIDGVLKQGKTSRFRSKTNTHRAQANHFFVNSPSVKAIYVNVGGVFVKFK